MYLGRYEKLGRRSRGYFVLEAILALSILAIVTPIILNSLKTILAQTETIESELKACNEMMYVFSLLHEEWRQGQINIVGSETFAITMQDGASVRYSQIDGRLKRQEGAAPPRYLTDPNRIQHMTCGTTPSGRPTVTLKSERYTWTFIK